jgi:hypothetical protein
LNAAYGSLELHFSYAPTSAISVTVSTNICGTASFAEIDASDLPLPISLNISTELSEIAVGYIVCKMMVGGVVVDRSDYQRDVVDSSTVNIVVFFFNARVSVYLNSKWVYSYNLATVSYPKEITQSLTAVGQATTISNINLVELSDGREALFVDYESNGDNAISSIIQERPIENYPAVGRYSEFTYTAVKNDIVIYGISSYDAVESDSPSESSDGLVYSMDVGISIDLFTAKKLGLVTRLYRLPDLDSGVERAVTAIQKKARQSRHRITIISRLDPRLEVADVVVLNEVVITGTGTKVTDRVIVEDVSIAIQDGEYRSTITGRRDVDGL